MADFVDRPPCESTAMELIIYKVKAFFLNSFRGFRNFTKILDEGSPAFWHQSSLKISQVSLDESRSAVLETNSELEAWKLISHASLIVYLYSAERKNPIPGNNRRPRTRLSIYIHECHFWIRQWIRGDLLVLTQSIRTRAPIVSPLALCETVLHRSASPCSEIPARAGGFSKTVRVVE